MRRAAQLSGRMTAHRRDNAAPRRGDDVKRAEDPYRTTPPPWQGWPSPETSRRRWRIALLVPLVGLAGCGLIFLFGAFALLLLVSRLSVPVPDGEPRAMRPAEIAGTWADGQGGRLELKADGTFAARGICGDFNDADLDTAVAPNPGVGTWTHDITPDVDTRDPATQIRLTFTPGGIWTQYDARGTAKNPLLWDYVGDPDEGDLCVLRKAAGRGGG